MTDKVAPMASAPVSSPSKETPVEAKVAQPGKDDEGKPQAEPGPASTVKR